MNATRMKQGTPAERRRQKVRQTILDAAERVFAEEGEGGLSIRRLADEIDYSPGAIYKYFDSKQTLIDELKEAFFARLITEIEKRGEFEGTPETYPDFAAGCIRTYIRVALEKPFHYGAAFSGRMDEGKAVPHPEDDSYKSRAFALLSKTVARGVELGAFRSDLDAIQMSKSVWASCHGFISLQTHLTDFAAGFSPDARPTDEAFTTGHVDFVIGGLCA